MPFTYGIEFCTLIYNNTSRTKQVTNIFLCIVHNYIRRLNYIIDNKLRLSKLKLITV
jgi:hypothetical protein